MSMVNIIHVLTANKIKLKIDNGKISIEAPKGAMTPSLLAELKEYKEEIIEYLVSTSKTYNISVVERNVPLYTSFSQQRLWLLDKIDGGSAHYNMPTALTLSGVLNIEALKKAFKTVLARHESLRTHFIENDVGEPIQVIKEVDDLLIPQIDLSRLEGNALNTEVRLYADRDANQPFNLSEDVMIRAQVLKLSNNEHVLLVNMHHIASDGWSIGILIKEFSALYTAYVQGKSNPLSPLPIQYADYAHWQRNWLQGDVLAQQLSYWTEQLADLPVVHSLPLDNSRPNVQSFNGQQYFSQISAASTEKLNILCQSQRATLFMGLQAAFSVLLSRYSNETDIVMGTPIANREQAEIAELIGFFVNTLVLRSDLSGNPTFNELLSQSKAMLLGAYEHQQVSFEQLVEQLQPVRSLSHTPLFQVMLIMQNNEYGVLELPRLTLSPLEEEGTDSIAKYDLTLSIKESKEGLFLAWEYNYDLFKAETITRMANHFERLLNGLVTAPDENVFKATLLSDFEIKQQLITWNDTAAAYPKGKCIHELFEEQVEKAPESIAVVFEGVQLTYNELNLKANQLAHYLVEEKNVKPNTLVGICLERSLDMVVGILAILKSGGAYVPLAPDYPKARLEYMLADAGLETVLTQIHLVERTPLQESQAVCVDDIALLSSLAGYPITNMLVGHDSLTSENLAYVIYTSGSTGQPKGVEVQHKNISNLAFSLRDILFQQDLKGSYRWCWNAPIIFDSSVKALSQLLFGVEIHIISEQVRLSSSKLLDYLHINEIDLLDITPSLLDLLLDKSTQNNAALTNLIIGGEAITPYLWNKICQHNLSYNCFALNMYGPTECSVNATSSLITPNLQPTIGKPLNSVHTYILDESLQLQPKGTVGELYIGGAGVAKGYYNDNALTTKNFIANPFIDGERIYRTGDRVRWLKDGDLEFIGRIDEQVKIRGYRVDLSEIENHILSFCGISETTVLTLTSSGNDSLVAYIVKEADKKIESKTIIEFLKGRLPVYMIPVKVVILDVLPLTTNGKIDKSVLQKHEVIVDNVIVEASTESEITLVVIWKKILKLECISIDSNFFELGGHSLLAMRLLNYISREMNIEIDINKIFEKQDIQNLAAYIDTQKIKQRNLTMKDEKSNSIVMEW